jgi:hypothetical protein
MRVAIGDHDAERGPAADGAGDDFVRERAYKLSASYSRLRASPRVDVVLGCAAFGGCPKSRTITAARASLDAWQTIVIDCPGVMA